MNNECGHCIILLKLHFLTTKKTVDLSHNGLSSTAGKMFGEMMSINTTLLGLELNWNQLFPEAGKCRERNRNCKQQEEIPTVFFYHTK